MDLSFFNFYFSVGENNIKISKVHVLVDLNMGLTVDNLLSMWISIGLKSTNL